MRGGNFLLEKLCTSSQTDDPQKPQKGQGDIKESKVNEWPIAARIWFNFIKSEKTIMVKHMSIALRMHLDNKILDSKYFALKCLADFAKSNGK